MKPHTITTCAVLGVGAVLVAFVLLQARHEVGHPEKDTLTVVTYNVHQGFDNAGKINPTIKLKVLKKLNPDIIGLQESETNRLIWGNYGLTHWLACKLHMYYYYGPSTRQPTYGVSLLSRYPLRNCRTYRLASEEDHWLLVEADITHRGRTVRIMTVHLGISVEDRFNQMKWILYEKIKKSTCPVILMGDFNTTDNEDFSRQRKPVDVADGWHSNRLRNYDDRVKESLKKNIYARAGINGFRGLVDYRTYVTDTWQQIHPNEPNAYSWFDSAELLGVAREKLDPPARIDYVFASKDFSVIDSRIVVDSDALRSSDHMPVVSVLTLKAGK